MQRTAGGARNSMLKSMWNGEECRIVAGETAGRGMYAAGGWESRTPLSCCRSSCLLLCVVPGFLNVSTERVYQWRKGGV